MFRCTYTDKNNKPAVLQMGSNGIGVTRLLAACVECLSTDVTIRWPVELAPFRAVVIGPKKGSKEEAAGKVSSEDMYAQLDRVCPDDVLLDDRSDMTIGKRVLEAKRTGYSFIIVLGKGATQVPPIAEVINTFTGEEVHCVL